MPALMTACAGEKPAWPTAPRDDKPIDVPLTTVHSANPTQAAAGAGGAISDLIQDTKAPDGAKE
jgi:hypothetical protein